jgi:hypothetical protein
MAGAFRSRAVAKALDARFTPGRLEHTVETLIQGRTPRVVVFVGSNRMR